MSSPQSRHVSEERIQDYIEGKLPEKASQIIEQHLNSCRDCMKRFEAIAVSGFRNHPSLDTQDAEEIWNESWQKWQSLTQPPEAENPGRRQNGH